MKSWLRRLVIFAIWIALIFWVTKAFYRAARNDTSFSTSTDPNAFIWPVVNICPLYFGKRINPSKSFEDAVAEINRTKASLLSQIATAGLKADVNPADFK